MLVFEYEYIHDLLLDSSNNTDRRENMDIFETKFSTMKYLCIRQSWFYYHLNQNVYIVDY